MMKSRSESNTVLLIVGIVLIAINLRPALAGVGPLVEDIRRSTGLSSSALGLLTTLPLIAFGVVSTLTPLLTRRFGIAATLAGAMGLLSVGVALRGIASLPALFIGTLLSGVAIALGNVLLPTLTKRNFPEQSGLVTSLYSSVMGLGAALAAGISVPLAAELDAGWRGSLAAWAIPAGLAFAFWLTQVRGTAGEAVHRSFWEALRHLGGSKLAWSVALFMGFQSLTFYVVLAWLPAVLTSRGASEAEAGWLLSLSQATGIIGSLIIPTLAGRRPDQRGFVLGLTLLEGVALAGLFVAADTWAVVWVVLIGFVLGGSFGLSLLFIVLRSGTTQSATELSGIAQSVGYLVAAAGPTIFGGLYDWTLGWDWPFALLFGVAAIKLAVGLIAGSAGTVDPAGAQD